jgi:ATPase family associated with various cellular activities (AAA)
MAFDDLQRLPANHFRLYYFAAVAHVIREVTAIFPDAEAAFHEFPFLIGYRDELARRGAGDDPRFWETAIANWEKSAKAHLPLKALREMAALDHRTLGLLFCIGLTEEDGRFGLLFEALQSTPGVHRPTMGLLNAWWREPTDSGEVRAALRRLRDLGLTRVTNPEAPRVEWALEPFGPLWDALRGELNERPSPWLRHRPRELLAKAGELVLTDSVRETLKRLPLLLERGEVNALIVRGPHHGGRRTLAGAVAHSLGLGLLEVNELGAEAEQRARAAGTLATLLQALPVVVLKPAAGETVTLPAVRWSDGPIAVVMGPQGGVTGVSVERSITIALEIPGPAARKEHWISAGGLAEADRDAVTARFRMTSGNIRRTATLARSYAALAGRSEIGLLDVQEASRALNRQALDTLAMRLAAEGDWTQLAVGAETQRELWDLERRCRYRERLQALVGPALQHQLRSGVRALLQGPSGTGKTLAAKLLASVMKMDVYRVDLASVVNKYIGETEKNLSRIFSLAEELDVILLLDEGDALLARRTAVNTSNDRYANLETNYLLQRIESFEGILLLTTNAGDHIDPAFQRRMDVVVDFRPPEAPERWAIWQLHLPAAHEVDLGQLREIARRCQLTGGQIRNAVLHAAMLALDANSLLRTDHLEAAVQREYRKAGAVCPLRRAPAPVAQVQ